MSPARRRRLLREVRIYIEFWRIARESYQPSALEILAGSVPPLVPVQRWLEEADA